MSKEKEIRKEFASIETKIQEVKELIPELYFIPSLEKRSKELVDLLGRRREICKELETIGAYNENN